MKRLNIKTQVQPTTARGTSPPWSIRTKELMTKEKTNWNLSWLRWISTKKRTNLN